jgi:ferric-dicitrate binding protein FerR (iron transport regulator)
MTQDRIWELIAKKLSGEAIEPELKELEDMLRQQPDIHYAIQTVADVWHHNLPSQEDAYAAFQKHAARMKELGMDYGPEEKEEVVIEPFPETPRRKPLRYVLLALSIAVIAIAGVYGYQLMFPKAELSVKTLADKSEVSTKYGSKTKLVLPDGSQVWLNAGSKLTYDKNYGNAIREVSLSGEAFFDVVKNAARPFVIHTEKIDIRVLGTAFNVKSYPGEKNTETSLIRGSIEVTIHNRLSGKIILKPNEKLVIANEEEPEIKPASHKPAVVKATAQQEPFVAISHLTYQPADSTIVETSWMDNKLIFRSQAFEELALRLQRWYDLEIIIKDEQIKKKKFTGVFENETIDQALMALQFTAPFKYVINKKQVTIFSK